MLQGSLSNFVTPTDETRTNLFTDEGNAATRLRIPSQSVFSGVLSPSQRLDGKAVVPVQQITSVTPSKIDALSSSGCRVSPVKILSLLISCLPNKASAFYGSRINSCVLTPRSSNLATTICPTPPVPPTTNTDLDETFMDSWTSCDRGGDSVSTFTHTILFRRFSLVTLRLNLSSFP